jgi:serine/threonine-protein kinase
MDRNEVTIEEYAKFINATGHRAPPDWKEGDYAIVAARKPVTGVDWYDANSYAKWAGKRLPTEVEWEFAARGTDGRLYPWGNEWGIDSANADVSSRQKMLDVGALPDGASPFGLFDMVGNAWEWTSSPMQAYPGGNLPETVPQDSRVIRGGSCKDDRRSGATATYRGYLRATGSPDYSVTGFRCVKDVSR